MGLPVKAQIFLGEDFEKSSIFFYIYKQYKHCKLKIIIIQELYVVQKYV